MIWKGGGKNPNLKKQVKIWLSTLNVYFKKSHEYHTIPLISQIRWTFEKEVRQLA